MALLQTTRPTFWQISIVGKAIFYYLAAVTVLVFLVGVYQRIQEYTQAAEEPVPRTKDIVNRIQTGAATLGSNLTLFDRDTYAGVWHLFVFWGFLTLLIATTILGIDIDIYRPLTGESFFVGDFYLSYSFIVDAMGLLFVVGLGVAIYRRHIRSMGRLQGPYSGREDVMFLWALFLLGVGGFALEGVRILGTSAVRDVSFETVSFVGWSIKESLVFAGVTPEMATIAYWPLWWSHALLAFWFIAWIPYGKPFHMLASASNIMTSDDDAGRRLPGVPLDPGADTDLNEINDFSWKQVLDQDACTKCGKCSSACPANASGRPLDPQKVILDLKNYRESHSEDGENVPIVADGGTSVINAQAMDSCMSCMACMDACPVEIEHLTHFTDMNRQLVEQGDVDDNLQDVFQNLMQQGNTFGDSARNRPDWTEGLEFEVPDARDEPVEYLWYVGDYPSYDSRNQEVAKALARVFEAADIDYGILYEDEVYDGNDIRRLGEELLYVEQASTLIGAMEKCDFDTIVCTDPHSYNTIVNEYPEIDFDEFADDPMLEAPVEGYWNENGEIDVAHYTQVVDDLIDSSAITIPDSLEYTATYHDPCHLGRYNDEFEAPRSLITETGCDLYEMPRNRDESFCCGGGGGGLWMDLEEDSKPSEERLREALEDTTAGDDIEKFVVACPMCMTMYEDGRKTGGYEDEIDIIGVTELLAEALQAKSS